MRAGSGRGVTLIEHEATADGYEQYYGLIESPFSLSPDPRFLFESRSHSAAIELVMQAFRRREALVVITGEIGTGKTVLCRTVLKQLPRRTFLSVITNPLLTSAELLRQVLEDFGILSKDHSGREQPSQHDLIRILEQFLASLIPLQAHAVIMIDEAQHLRPAVLEQVRLLSNFETDSSKLLQIVLVGQPDLAALLSRPELKQLEQRITHRCELLPLDPAEVEYYIERRLWIAHGSELDPAAEASRVRFLPAAMSAVAVCSRGLPRVVNLLCDRALEDAYLRRKRVVDLRAVLNAAKYLEIPVPRRTRFQPYRYAAVAAAVVVVGSGAWLATRAMGVSFRRAPVAAAVPARSGAAAGSSADTSGSPSAAAAPAPQAGPLRAGDAFTVLVASFRTPMRAQAVSDQVAALDLPGFVRAIPGDWQQVFVGPFASREESEDALHRLDQAQLTGGKVLTTPTSDVPSPEAVASSAVVRISLLPAAERAALVLDLAEDVARAVSVAATDNHSFEVEIGPLRQGVVAQELQAAAQDVVERVSIRRAAASSDTLARVTVKTRIPVTGAVRVSKRRVYIDLVPRTAVAAEAPPIGPPTSAPTSAPVSAPVSAPANAPASALAAPVPASPAPQPAPAANAGVATNERWERALLDRAREFAKVPDVRAIQRLRAELLARRGRPADEPPTAVAGDRTMTELVGYLEVAQKLQLAMDARLLRESQEK